MATRRLGFRQVDVFTATAMLGNPVAVVHDADDLDEQEMLRFARWTNLSETTFLLAPTDPGADYQVRIFTPGGELPFAGHPTLGSAHAWLEAGGTPPGAEVVQQCRAGLVRVRRADRSVQRLAFQAPPLTRSGPVAERDLDQIRRALRLLPGDLLDASWVVNGPKWVAVLLRDADTVLALRPDVGALAGWKIGAVGAYDAGSECAVEVRAFYADDSGFREDPVTGSLNAGIGQWLAGDRLPASYVAAQGTALGRRGRVHVSAETAAGETSIWVGGDTVTTVCGDVSF